MTWKRYLRSQDSGIKFKTVMTEGNPAVEIVKTAADENVDVIVMDRKKHSR